MLDFEVTEREGPPRRNCLLSEMFCQYQKCLNDKINVWHLDIFIIVSKQGASNDLFKSKCRIYHVGQDLMVMHLLCPRQEGCVAFQSTPIGPHFSAGCITVLLVVRGPVCPNNSPLPVASEKSCLELLAWTVVEVFQCMMVMALHQLWPASSAQMVYEVSIIFCKHWGPFFTATCQSQCHHLSWQLVYDLQCFI